MSHQCEFMFVGSLVFKRVLMQGFIAATFTPIAQDGSVNLEAIPAMVDRLVGDSIAGLYILGSTGEGLSLTFAERRIVCEVFVKAAEGRLPVIVQVGSESLRESAELAKHALQVGADAVSAVSPVYFKPDSVETLVDSMTVIAEGAVELPFYYYHIPGATGLNVSILEFMVSATNRIPNFRGIKFTSPHVHEFQACVELATGDVEILWGVDEMLLSGLAAGATAAVGSTYNFAAPIYHHVLSAFESGDWEQARRWQSRSQELVRTFVPYGPRAAQKAIMSLVGFDCGPPRLPIAAVSEQDIERLREALAGIGFFEWLKQSSH